MEQLEQKPFLWLDSHFIAADNALRGAVTGLTRPESNLRFGTVCRVNTHATQSARQAKTNVMRCAAPAAGHSTHSPAVRP